MTMIANVDTMERAHAPRDARRVESRTRERLSKPDRPRAIDRYIDYFGEHRGAAVLRGHGR